MGVVLRAGLETMAANRDILFETAEVKALVEATVTPVIAAFPSGLAEQLEWEQVADALMEPAASAAFRIIAENPSAFSANGSTRACSSGP